MEKSGGEAGRVTASPDEPTPRQTVEELDKYIVGQSKAKRALALALRDRVRRQKLPPEIADEVQPRNIILIGSTGVGKTELARRLARLSDSPFLKIEASKFSEVGYVGRDVESIVRDLAEISFEMVREEKALQVEKLAEENALDRLLELLTSGSSRKEKKPAASAGEKSPETRLQLPKAKQEELRRDLVDGRLNDRMVELEVQERFFPPGDFVSVAVDEDAEVQLKDLLAGMLGARTFKRRMKVEEAMSYLLTEEESKLIDIEQVAQEAIDRVEQSGIVFVDELDKIAGREGSHGPDVSREGVQRDILPIVEGTAVSTRYGIIQTDHILFIAAGAFHVSKPSDLIPELQGRFPVRVEMDSLVEKDFVEILKEPKNSLIKQYSALMDVEGVTLKFTDDAVKEVAHYAWLVNQSSEDIGARRLVTVMEALLEDISFKGPELKDSNVEIDGAFVRSKLSDIVKDADLSRYIL